MEKSPEEFKEFAECLDQNGCAGERECWAGCSMAAGSCIVVHDGMRASLLPFVTCMHAAGSAC